MKKSLVLLFVIFFYYLTNAQVWFSLDNSLEVSITAETDIEHIKTFLEAD